MKTVYLEVKLNLDDEADVYDVVTECDYTFIHPQIIDTEITSIVDENSKASFPQG